MTYRKCCVSTRYYYKVTKKKKECYGHGTQEWERQFLEALVYFQLIHSKLMPHSDRAERVVSGPQVSMQAKMRLTVFQI